jgi:homogentisate 1,2-dioxygenase
MLSKAKLCKELCLKVKVILISDQNSPVKLRYGVFAEQLSGTAFTVKRCDNQKVWLYKVRPSAIQGQYAPSKR